MPTRAPSLPNLASLQAGRGVAALMVVLFHATVIFASPKYWNVEILKGIFRFGFSGVEFFFVLSGFLMVFIHKKDAGRPKLFWKYAQRRAVRIYPVYWTVFAPLISAYLIKDGFGISEIAYGFLLIGPSPVSPIGVAWTLFHEILFYIIFGLTIFRRQIGILALTIWLLTCIFWFNDIPPHYAFSSINLLFGFGAAAALFYRHTPVPRLTLVGGIVAFLLMGFETVFLGILTEDEREIAFGIAATLIIAGAVRAEELGLFKSFRWLSELGDSSYSLYLIHYPLLSIFAKIWFSSPLRQTPPLPVFFFAILVCVFAGVMFHRAIELPLLRLTRQWLSHWSGKATP